MTGRSPLVRRVAHRVAAGVLARIDALEAENGRLREQIAALDGRVHEAQLGSIVAREALALMDVARSLPKRDVVLLIEAEADYGNLGALGRALLTERGTNGVAVIARDEESAGRWRALGVRADPWTTASDVGAAPLWQLALTSAVTVYEHHDWWRLPERLVLRALVSGSKKVQLWHGGSPPYSKQVAMGVLSEIGDMGSFVDITTTSSGYAALVCEPRDLDQRLGEFQFSTAVADVDFRMVEPLRRAAAAERTAGPPRILLAPTYPETEAASAELERRMATYRDLAAARGAHVEVRHHPWTVPSIVRASGDLPLLGREVDLYDVIDDYDVLITDFSSLAADMLLLGRRVVLDHSVADTYLAGRALLEQKHMLALCDIAADPAQALAFATGDDDPLAGARRAAAHDRLGSLAADPGDNTLAALRDLIA